MKGKIFGILVCMLLLITVIPSNATEQIENSSDQIDYSYLYKNDAIIPPEINDNEIGRSPDPGYYDLSEYMIGTIAIGIIFLESDGSIDPSTEDWTQNEKTQAMSSLGLPGGYLQWSTWFSNENMNAHTVMIYGETHTINISYEPIIHESAITNDYWEKLYVSEAMSKLGYSTGDWMKRVRDYSNYLRDNIQTLPGYYGTDWAFTVFLVDNSNDADGLFSDGYHAYAYLGGPFTVCPHLRPGGPPGPVLRDVFAHEMGHIFYATDEYNSQTEYSGYLNAADVEGSGCIMDNLNLCLSSGTKLQVGWLDSDSDGIANILDTNPETTLNAYTPDPTSDPTPIYSGSATVQPLNNNNPHGPKNDVSTNSIALVEYRVDGGTWTYASPSDGTFDDAIESFTFTTPPLSDGTHTIEARATNSVGNKDLSPSSDTITVVNGNSEPYKPSAPVGPLNGGILKTYTYNTGTTDPEGDQISYFFDWGDGTNSAWVGPYNSGNQASASKMWLIPGNYQIKVKAKDTNGAESQWSDSVPVQIPRDRQILSHLISRIAHNHPNLYLLLRYFICNY